MDTLDKIFRVVLISIFSAWVGVSFVTKEVNPAHWGASLRNHIAIQDAKNRKLEKIAEEALGLYNQVLRKAEMYDGKVGLSWYDKAKLSQDLGVDQVIEEGSRIDLKYSHKSSSLNISVTNNSLTPAYTGHTISKEKLSEYIGSK